MDKIIVEKFGKDIASVILRYIDDRGNLKARYSLLLRNWGMMHVEPYMANEGISPMSNPNHRYIIHVNPNVWVYGEKIWHKRVIFGKWRVGMRSIIAYSYALAAINNLRRS